MHPLRTAFACLLVALPLSATAAGPACQRTATAAPTVVELYTSEGCSSCPPADQWLSTLVRSRPDVVALAFHVDYWNGLGWKDRFADPAYTQRQRELTRYSGVGYVYTPQVVVNGRDHRGWPRLPQSQTAASPVTLELAHDGSGYVATLARLPAARGVPLTGYWAVTEDGHATRVRAGENNGATLAHDAVVREYLPVALPATGTTEQLRFVPGTPSQQGRARRVVFVVARGDTGTVLQAASLAC